MTMGTSNIQGRVVITDPGFIEKLYYMETNDWKSLSASLLNHTTMLRTEATLLNRERSDAVIEEFVQAYSNYWGYDSVEQMTEDGISIVFEVGE
jgi:predicted component of type VI protein secretion system